MNAEEIESFVKVAHSNLIALRTNLLEIGYLFSNPNEVIVRAERCDCDKLNRLEEQHGPLPLILRAWYQTFRCINFSQAESQLFAPDPINSVVGLGYNGVLVLQDIDSAIEMRNQLRRTGIATDRNDEQSQRYLFPTGAIASNCCPKGVWLPDQCVDPVLYDDGGGPVTFSDELKNALDSGGFPFWRKVSMRKQITLPIKHQPKYLDIYDRLKNGFVEF